MSETTLSPDLCSTRDPSDNLLNSYWEYVVDRTNPCDNYHMSQTPTIELPGEQADRLEAEAKAMGLTVPAYIKFLQNCQQRQHDPKFVDAAKYVFRTTRKRSRNLPSESSVQDRTAPDLVAVSGGVAL